MLLKNSQKKSLSFWLFNIFFLLCFNNALSQNITQNSSIKNKSQSTTIKTDQNNNFEDFSDLGVLKDIVEDEELPTSKPQILEEDDKVFLNPDIFDPNKKKELLAKPIILNVVTLDISMGKNCFVLVSAFATYTIKIVNTVKLSHF